MDLLVNHLDLLPFLQQRQLFLELFLKVILLLH